MFSQPLSSQVNLFHTAEGAQIFQIPVHEFPGLWGWVYLVLVHDAHLGEMRVLIDTGSGIGESNQHLEEGIARVSDMAGRKLGLEDLTHILITHGHIDHFGGLTFLRQRSSAQVGVHELDQRVLTRFEERVVIVAKRLEEFLIEAGVSSQGSRKLIEMYQMLKSMYRSVGVDFTYEAQGMRLGPFEMLHVPGHCAGHVVIRLHDVLFSGDHVLEGISPHQAPERLTHHTGLSHYLESLERLKDWAQEVRLTLGGHNQPLFALDVRLQEIQELHRQRLALVSDFLQNPHTIAEVSHTLFGEVHGYEVLLALEEAGAHVEYLHQRGWLAIDNLGEIENGRGCVPVYYRAVGKPLFRKN